MTIQHSGPVEILIDGKPAGEVMAGADEAAPWGKIEVKYEPPRLDYDKMVFYGRGLRDGYQRMINEYVAALFPEYNHGRREGARQRDNMNETGRRGG